MAQHDKGLSAVPGNPEGLADICFAERFLGEADNARVIVHKENFDGYAGS